MKKRTINPEKKMTKVLLTARRLFVENGYYGVSIPSIVKASGVSTGAIYSYFKDKEGLAKKSMSKRSMSSILFFRTALRSMRRFIQS